MNRCLCFGADFFGVEKLKIQFAHRTFQWSNEAKGMAAVHCVIIGLGREKSGVKLLFDYTEPRGEAHLQQLSNISPYLTEGPDRFVIKRHEPLCDVPEMRCGNKPTDNGNLILSREERDKLIKESPKAKKWLRRYAGGEDFLYAYERYCLWLPEASPSEIREIPEIMNRVEAVRQFRLKSTAKPTRLAASTPSLFFFRSQPKGKYIFLPETSSERRIYVPVGMAGSELISSNANHLIASSELFHFGVLSSTMHMAWLRTVGGRLESRYRYSGSMVYNNFPWPESPTAKQKEAIEQAAEAVLDTRAKYFPTSSLADLYDPLTMPSDLLKAHQKLDKTVDAAYGKRQFATEAERVAYLFELYQNLSTPLLPVEKKTRKKSVSSLRD